MTSQESAPGPQSIGGRAVGFVHHLRDNGFRVGLAECEAALKVIGGQGAVPLATARRHLKALLTGSAEEWQRFDDLFEAYWMGRGRIHTVTRTVGELPSASGAQAPAVWQRHLDDACGATPDLPQARDDGSETDAAEGTGRLVASGQAVRSGTDFRHMTDPAEIAAAEAAALRLAQAMRYRLARRYRAKPGAPRLDLRRTIRRNIAHGGEPIRLVGRHRPDQPVRIVVFLDVSGSMQPYTRPFLQFVKGLVGGWADSDAYLVHTRLVRVTDALRDTDPMKAMGRLALMADGFGGGTRLAEALATFNGGYARRAVNSRTVALVMSDGYDTGSPERLADELARLKRRARRLVWLNPMLGWRDYQPVTRAMAAALPHIDHFAAAHTLDALAALDADLERL